MLSTEIEYKKGILFVRLCGEINSKTIKNLDILDEMIQKAGIKYLLINLEKVSIISTNQIDTIIDKYKKLIGDDGKLLICGYQKDFKLKVDYQNINKVYLPSNELKAFNIINI